MSVISLTLVPTYTVTLALVGDGNTISITTADDALVVELANVLRGEKGDDGDPGDPGPGLAAGGTTGQLAAKASDTDFDVEWIDPPNSAVWGAVAGTLSDQTDLQAALVASFAFAAAHG